MADVDWDASRLCVDVAAGTRLSNVMLLSAQLGVEEVRSWYIFINLTALSRRRRCLRRRRRRRRRRRGMSVSQSVSRVSRSVGSSETHTNTH